MTRDQDLRSALKAAGRRLCLSGESLAAFCESATAAQARAVLDLLEAELAVRERNRRERLMRQARLPQVKSFEGYDFSQVSFPDGYTADDLRSLAFLDSAEGFVFHGQTGRGKTHLAIALAAACVAAGRPARFYTAAELALMLSRADSEGRLEAAMRDLGRCDLLVVDEFGYVPIDVARSRLLFQVVADCYERRSLVLTTNIEFSKWGTVLGDDKLAAAMVDRIVHHGRMVEFGGASRRMDFALMLGRRPEPSGKGA